jgi:ribosomal protein S18 acetylase RimI-like enzyme
MRLERVGQTNRNQFIEYCAKYGGENDESYLPGDDFVVSGGQPSYVLLDDGRAVGAVSLIRTESYVEARKGRFAVFHALDGSRAAYTRLYQAIDGHLDGLNKIYMFIPRERRQAAIVLSELGFRPERFSYVLYCPRLESRPVDLGEGFRISTVGEDDGDAVETFTKVRNQSFGDSPGYAEVTSGEVRSWFEVGTYVKGGISMLYEGETPIGTICGLQEEGGDWGVIENLSVAAEYRGRGLGRQLLRHGINNAIEDGLTTLYLSVSGENDSAIGLYLSEGFELERTVVCYSKKV